MITRGVTEQYEPLVNEKYEEHILTDVTLRKGGFEIQHGPWGFWISNEENPKKIMPKIGDTAFFYGDGFGRPVLGIQLNDKLVFFRTREEEERDRWAMLETWRKRDEREYAELMEKIKDEPEFETVNVSGFGSGYERACQLMIRAGVKFLKENEFHFDYYLLEGVYGLCLSDAPWSKELDKVLREAVDGDCTGAMHQCVIGHLKFIYENDYEKWLNEFPKERRYIYPRELPPPRGITTKGD